MQSQLLCSLADPKVQKPLNVLNGPGLELRKRGLQLVMAYLQGALRGFIGSHAPFYLPLPATSTYGNEGEPLTFRPNQAWQGS